MRAENLFFLWAVAIFCLAFISSGQGAVDYGYPSKCFFSVGKSSSGRWWFIDPKGERFLSLGVDVVTWSGDTSKDGSKPYYDSVRAKFNNSQSAWADSVVSRIQSWGLNTLGAWSDTVVISKGMPYTRALRLGQTSGPWLNGLFPDVFDPAWEESVLEKAEAGCVPYRNDTRLIGYFIDNEMWWGPISGTNDWRFPGTMLDQMLIGLDLTSPSRQRAVSFLKTKYPTIDDLNDAWNTTYTSYDTTYTSYDTIETIPRASTAHTTDSNQFAYIAAVQFFNVTRNAIRKFDPYHLLLGVRFVGLPTEPVLRACSEYNDVISINAYPSTSERYGPPLSRIESFYNRTNKPLLIGEFAYLGNDTGLPNSKGAGLLVANQALRAEGYKNYTTRLVPHKHVIGMHWFQWSDQPAAGRESDGENSNFGLVNRFDEAYTKLTDQMTAVNPTLWTAHETTTTGLSAAQCYSSLSCPNSCSGHGCCDTNTGVCNCNTGFTGTDCGTDSTKLQVSSFGSSLDTTVWNTYSDPLNNQAYWPNSTSSSNLLQLTIAPCSTCGKLNFSAGGVRTKSNSYGYGIYTAFIKAPANSVSQLSSSVSTPLDAITLRIRGNSSQGGALDYYSGGTYKYLKWLVLPFANPSTGFHNYTIVYMPSYFAYYADSTLLGQYNSTTAANGLPDSKMAIGLPTLHLGSMTPCGYNL